MKFRRFGAAAVCLRDLYLWLSENHCNQSNKFRAGPTQFASPRYSLRSSPNFLHMTSPMTLCKRMLEWGKPRWTMHGGMAWRYTSYHSWLKTLYFQLFWDKRIWQSACIFKIRFAPLYILMFQYREFFPYLNKQGIGWMHLLYIHLNALDTKDSDSLRRPKVLEDWKALIHGLLLCNQCSLGPVVAECPYLFWESIVPSPDTWSVELIFDKTNPWFAKRSNSQSHRLHQIQLPRIQKGVIHTAHLRMLIAMQDLMQACPGPAPQLYSSKSRMWLCYPLWQVALVVACVFAGWSLQTPLGNFDGFQLVDGEGWNWRCAAKLGDMENTWKEHGKHKSRVCFPNLFGALPVFGQTYFFFWVTWGSTGEPGASSYWLLILAETTGPRSACSFLLQRVTYPLNKASKLRSLSKHQRPELLAQQWTVWSWKVQKRCDRSPFYRWFCHIFTIKTT